MLSKEDKLRLIKAVDDNVLNKEIRAKRQKHQRAIRLAKKHPIVYVIKNNDLYLKMSKDILNNYDNCNKYYGKRITKKYLNASTVLPYLLALSFNGTHKFGTRGTYNVISKYSRFITFKQMQNAFSTFRHCKNNSDTKGAIIIGGKFNSNYLKISKINRSTTRLFIKINTNHPREYLYKKQQPKLKE